MPDGPLRLEAAPHFRPPSLEELGADLHVVDGGRAQLVSSYWDTPDLRLARWGVSLVHSDDQGWVVWQPPGDHGAPVTDRVPMAGVADAPPDAALDLIRAYVRDAILAPVARVRRIRRTVAVHDAEDTELVRVLSDEISVLDGRRVAVRFRQVILDAPPHADIALVHGVLTRLRAAGAGGPDTADEHDRVLGPRASEPPEISVPALGPEASLADSVKAMIASSVTRLMRHDAGVRAGDGSEPVHQARVATRRMRSDLDTFRDVLDADRLRRVRTELKWLGGLLGEVRDTDVLISRIGHRLKEVEGPPAGRKALLESLVERRAEARRKLMAGMRGVRYSRLLDMLVEVAQDPPLKVPGDQPARLVLPGLAATPWRVLAKTVHKLPRDPADEQLHAVRIAAKRSRYAAEAAAPVIGRPAERFAEAIAGVQETLGDFNDAVVARQWLTSVAPSLDVGGAFYAGVLSERERSLGKAAASGWKKAWKAVDQGKLLRWMLDE